MTLEVLTPSRVDRGLIRRMIELYLHDFSEFSGDDLDEHGLFSYGDLDYFWFEETHVAFMLWVDGKLAGFVLVDNEVVIEGNQRSLTEFFVLRKYRKQGVGRRAALEVFDRMPAKWEVRVIAANQGAQNFWRRVIADFTKGGFSEVQLDNDDWAGTVFSFENGG